MKLTRINLCSTAVNWDIVNLNVIKPDCGAAE